MKVQIAPGGSPVQPRVTVPLKPFWGVIVTVLVTLLPADTLAGVSGVADVKNLVMLAAQAMASLSASTEPRPVTWS